jgi:hypothetical protein
VITQERIRELFDYAEDGKLVRRVSIKGRNEGEIAGSPNDAGYIRITVDGIRYVAHHLVWLWHRGELPISRRLDHCDLDKSNNRIGNLREATKSQNQANISATTRNKTGFKGVFWQSHAKKYRAMIYIDGRSIHLGYRDTPEAAHALYCAAARTAFKEFARSK